MERNKETLLLCLLLLAIVHVCPIQNCQSVPDNVHRALTCYSDYNRTITCVWNSVPDRPDSVCTIYAEWKSQFISYSNSCDLEPVDASRSTLRKCSMMFKRDRALKASDFVFRRTHNISINLSCKPGTQSLNIFFVPACHIKLNPPPKPAINSTTASWFPQILEQRSSSYCTQLQWTQEDQSWSDPKESCIQCKWDCTTELNPDQLIKGERYKARVRVKDNSRNTKSTWSDWGPTTSWVSPIGRPKPQTSDFSGLLGIVAGAAALAVFLIVLRYKTDKTTWVYIVKRIRGPPLPNPEKFFQQNGNFLSWMSPHFNDESFQSIFKPVEIVSVEVTSIVDGVTPCRQEAALLEKMRTESSQLSTSSNYSNPSYSCPPPPVTSLTAGNLPPCDTDTPYGPVVSQSEGKNEQQDRDEERRREVETRQLLSKCSNSSELMPVILDYEKVEKVQVERSRLQSLDSGMCSGEEVSQESLEADSITMSDSHDEEPEGEEEREGRNEKKTDLKKLFGGGGDIFGKGSIQVCSGYEQVQKLQADCPELPSLDSDISSGGEEQVSQEESLEDAGKSTESTSLLLPPPFSALPCSMPSFSLPLNFSGPGFSPALRPLSSHLLERIALLPTNRSVEPSSDGYMPVRQEQS